MNIISDNFTVSKPVILENLKNKNSKYFYEFFEKILKHTDIIDINFGQIKRDLNELAEFIFKIIFEVGDFKIVIDTVNHESIEILLNYCKTTSPILNAISYDSYKIRKILPIAAENNLEIIALIMDKNVPVSIDEKVSLTLEILTQCQEIGISPSKVIVDPVVAPIGWEKGAFINRNNLEFLKLVKEVVSGDIRTVMGFSNVSTGATGKNRSVRKLDSYYLSMAYMCGLDYCLVNVFDKNIQDVLNFIKVLEDKTIFSPAIFNE